MTFRPRPPAPMIPITILSLAPRTWLEREKTAGATRAPRPAAADLRRKARRARRRVRFVCMAVDSKGAEKLDGDPDPRLSDTLSRCKAGGSRPPRPGGEPEMGVPDAGPTRVHPGAAAGLAWPGEP